MYLPEPVTPKVSSKRQITLPVAQCEALGIEPGDEVEIFVADRRLTNTRKRRGAVHRLLKDVAVDPTLSD